MKKSLAIAAMSAFVFCSCSSDGENSPVVGGVKGLQPITIGLSETTTAQVKGTGTVGDIKDGDNVWRYEDIYVLMMTSDEKCLKEGDGEWYYTYVKELGYQFNNTFWARPEEGETISNLNYLIDGNGNTEKRTMYYPINGKSQFFAYYVDKACENNLNDAGHPKVDVDKVNKVATLAFKTDGSNDIMLGVAAKDSEGNPVDFDAPGARKGTNPVISMKHMTTRLTFELKSGDKNAEGVKVESIEVMSKTEGTLIVAYKDAESLKAYKDGIDANEQEDSKKFIGNVKYTGEKETVYLKEADPDAPVASLTNGKPQLKAFSGKVMGGEGFSENVGDALFVNPGENVYKLTIRQKVLAKINDVPTPTETTSELEIKLNEEASKAFEMGHSYHVKITIYNLEEIKVSAELEPWIDGGQIELGDDEGDIYPID